jgi:hypothetical protein
MLWQHGVSEARIGVLALVWGTVCCSSDVSCRLRFRVRVSQTPDPGLYVGMPSQNMQNTWLGQGLERRVCVVKGHPLGWLLVVQLHPIACLRGGCVYISSRWFLFGAAHRRPAHAPTCCAGVLFWCATW